MEIGRYTVAQDTWAARRRKHCASCDQRRLTTRCLLTETGTGQRLVRWFCNECLAERPSWSP